MKSTIKENIVTVLLIALLIFAVIGGEVYGLLGNRVRKLNRKN